MKFKINLFLKLVYWFFKSIVLVCFALFYRKKTKRNEHFFDNSPPSIIISNHPNTMMDPLVTAKEKNIYVHFLANAGLFSTKFTNWFFTTFFCIKVERPKDVQGRRINNDKAFKHSADFLARYGTLYAAAEGTSKLERRLRKLKTGAARIALDAMRQNDWNLPLTIKTVGITYENPKLARYDLFINYGEPIQVSNYKELYQDEPIKAVKKLTADIQTKMQSLLLHTDVKDEDIDKIVQKLERIHKNEFGNSHDEQFDISKAWIASLLKMKYQSSDKFTALKNKVNSYCSNLTDNNITDKAVQDKGNAISNTLMLILGLIPAMWGWLNNILAFWLPDFIMQKTKLYPGYTTTVKVICMGFLFPFTYLIQYKLVGALGLGAFVPLIYIISSFLLGLFALHYFRYWKEKSSSRQLGRLKRSNIAIYSEIHQARKEIVNTVFSQLTP